jgi:hypothetical protein
MANKKFAMDLQEEMKKLRKMRILRRLKDKRKAK